MTTLPLIIGTLAVTLFTLMDAVMKGLTLAIGAYNAVLWRMMVGTLLTGAIYFAGGPRMPSGQALRLHAIRGVVTSVMAVSFFWGLARLPLAEAISLSFVGPLVTLYFASLLLKEAVGKRAVVGSVLGLAGVVVIVATRSAKTGDEGDLWGAGAVLLGAVLWGYNMALMRMQAVIGKPMEIAFFQALLVSLCLGIAAPFLLALPSPQDWPTIGLAASLALLGMVLTAWAYGRAEAQRLAPLEYTALISATLLGWVMFGEGVDASTFAGAGLIIAGCVTAARKGLG